MPEGSAWGVPGVLSFRIVHRRLTIIYDVIKAWCPGQFVTPPAEPSCPGPCSSANSKDLQQFTYSTIISAPLSRNPKISFLVLLSRSCFLWTSSPVFSVDFHNCQLPSNLHSHHDMWSGHQQSPNFKIEFLHVWEYSHRCASPTGVSEGNNPGGLWCWAEEVWLPIQTVCVVFMWKSNIQLQSVALKTRVPSLLGSSYECWNGVNKQHGDVHVIILHVFGGRAEEKASSQSNLSLQNIWLDLNIINLTSVTVSYCCLKLYRHGL